jgi:hypothetical protein
MMLKVCESSKAWCDKQKQSSSIYPYDGQMPCDPVIGIFHLPWKPASYMRFRRCCCDETHKRKRYVGLYQVEETPRIDLAQTSTLCSVGKTLFRKSVALCHSHLVLSD